MPKLMSESTTKVYEVTSEEVNALFRTEDAKRAEAALELLHSVMRTTTPEKINFLPFKIDVLAAVLGIQRGLIAEVSPQYAIGSSDSPVDPSAGTVTERQSV